MRWPRIVFAVGAILAGAGLYFAAAEQEWSLGSLLLVVGLAGMGGAVLALRPAK